MTHGVDPDKTMHITRKPIAQVPLSQYLRSIRYTYWKAIMEQARKRGVEEADINVNKALW